MEDYIERVVIERSELLDKIRKLTGFIYSERVLNISKKEQDRMQKQLYIMLEYARILSERISEYILLSKG